MVNVLTITGPSCSGKSTLERRLCASPKFYRTVSATTRPPRSGEVDGDHYYFVSDERMDELISSNQTFEHVEFGGFRYCGLVLEFQRAWALGATPVVVCEPQGAWQIARWSVKNGCKHTSVYFTAQDYVVGRFTSRLHDAATKDGMPASKVLERMRSFLKEMTDVGDTQMLQGSLDHVVVERFETEADLQHTVGRIEQAIGRSA